MTVKKTTQRQGFKTNEFIVYPAHGVGQIVAIEEQEVSGLKLELFVINFVKDKMTLRVPTTKVAAVGMRKLAEEPMVKRALETLKGRARIKRTMVRGGVSPQERSLLSAAEGGQPITKTYRCSGADELQFVLGFQDQGARLCLSVIDPGGERYEKSGTKTFTIEVPAPAPGDWQCTITPRDVPYRNFPFTLTIGEK